MQKEVLGCFLHSLPVATEVTVMSSWVDSSLYPYLWAVRMIWTLFGLGRKSERYLTGFPWSIPYRMSLISTYDSKIQSFCFISGTRHLGATSWKLPHGNFNGSETQLTEMAKTIINISILLLCNWNEPGRNS